ncbi:hypothetical protein EKK58_00275 [Candidatus Dependentiae bacterium]|nr:MAG: hypothetical protein EKK58_00275 [Candidatus Dependentiae bacterium]
MQIQQGNLWEYHGRGHWVCVTTNGIVNADGLLIMGRGVALEAVERFPGLRRTLGQKVRQHGNVPILCPQERVISFPTKHHWRDPSDLTLIRASTESLKLCWPIVRDISTMAGVQPLPICLPKVGCGNGGLDWNTQVLPILNGLLDDNYIAIL